MALRFDDVRERLNKKIVKAEILIQVVRKALEKGRIARQRAKVDGMPRLRANRMKIDFELQLVKRAYGKKYPTAWINIFTPPEIFHAAGIIPISLEVASAVAASMGVSARALSVAEENFFSRDTCSYHRCGIGAALEDYLPRPDILVATSLLCDGTGKTFHNASEIYRREYILLDVPYDRTPEAEEYVSEQLRELAKILGGMVGKPVDEGRLAEAIRLSNEARQFVLQAYDMRKRVPSPMRGREAQNFCSLLYMGLGTHEAVEVYRTLYEELKERSERGGHALPLPEERFRVIWMHLQPHYDNAIFDYLEDTAGASVVAEELGHIYWDEMNPEDPYRSLARKIMGNHANGPLENRLEAMAQLVRDYRADAVIHFSHWGCRQSCGGVRILKDGLAGRGIPLLNLDGDCVDSRNYSDGQMRTRIEGFFEKLPRPSFGETPAVCRRKSTLVAGVDVGSLSADAVILNGSGEIVAYSVIPTGADSRAAAQRSMDEALRRAGAKMEDVSYIVATGYGRINIPFAHKRVTEITCHGRGALFIFPDAHTVIDIGGQDSKVIKLDEGEVIDFAMNDKCAAGTGRFLEVMAKALEVNLEELGRLALIAKNGVTISSMCTVFAESEVVSLIAEGHPKEDIIRGLHEAIAGRILGMCRRVGVNEAVVMTGGVAKNPGMVRALEERLKLKIKIPPEPQIVGALGAALIAREEMVGSAASRSGLA
ncbi:MAG: acyl-CoA dehydratase activase [bacterium]